MQCESTPPAKRKRGDSNSGPVMVPRRSEKFWFDDGSVVLQVENTQFRVHRSILASHSTVFDDLFQVPQPESDKSDWVDGCPTVCMSGDTTEDWDHILAVMYKPSLLPMKCPDVRKLASMMRLGKKYQLDDIFQIALTRLKEQFPRDLAAYDSGEFIANNIHAWVQTYFEDITCIGEEMALWSILPITYFIAASGYAGISELLLAHPNISSNSVRSISSGSSAIWKDIVERGFAWTTQKATERIIPSKGCISRTECIITCMYILEWVFAKIGSQDIHVGLDIWKNDSGHEFCAECDKRAQRAFRDGRSYIWNNLGKYFLGDGWEKLQDTKSEVWPVIWKPR